jgi:DNA polymerase-3 subunit alpha
MSLKFTHLHTHSHYSLLDGLPKIDELLDRVKELGMDSVAITDHGVLYGAVEFYKKAKSRQIKPIIGAEMYLALESMDARRPNIDDVRYHFILLVKDAEGYRNLVKLITQAHLRGFYYKPRVDEELLAKHAKGLIMLSGCLQGKIPRLILAGKKKEAMEVAMRYKTMFGKDGFYLELQHHPNIEEQAVVNKALLEISKACSVPVVATQDSHYLRPEDAEAQDVLMLINTGADLDNPERLSMKEDDFSLKSPQEMAEYFSEIPAAIENTQKIADMCNFEFDLGKVQMPLFPLPEGKTADDYLRELCFDGLKRKGLYAMKEARERLTYELESIKQAGFASYFLIVQDLVNWAKQNRIVVGPGRGSVGGSLIAYVLNITNVNPLEYGLLFERFLNPERVSPPDIDLDFADRRRDEVIAYVAQKYGRERVAQIGTFGTMAARAVVRDVGRALGYSYGYCDRLAKMIPFSFTLKESLQKVKELRDLYETDEKTKRLIDIAQKLEGVARHVSTHACGVVISKDPLDTLIPLQHPSQSEQNIITQYEMHAIESLGLLKMDFLGLRNLTIIEDTLARIYKIHGKNINIDTIPLDDKKTYTLLQKGETVGVFQLESSGMQRYLRELKPTHLEDIIAMVALYRPGPMEWIPEYIARKHQKHKVEYLHPALEPILKNTYGICVYQEQVMQIAQRLAGFTLAEADILRKAVGKKIKSLLLEQKTKLVEGMRKCGIPEKVAQEIWEWILPFARYGFNRSHSACYAMIAYQTAYLKANYPMEFMAALMTAESTDVERTGFLIEECKRMGIEVLPPDINESFRTFSVVPNENKIRFGLLAIKNVGHNVVEAIVEERTRGGKFSSLEDFLLRIDQKVLNKKSLESLIRAGAFDRFEERGRLFAAVELLLEFARDSQRKKRERQGGLFDRFPSNGSLGRLRLETFKTASEKEKLQWERELLGLYVSGHPLKDYRKVLAARTIPLAHISQELVGKLVKIGGVVAGVKKIITKTGKPMLFVNVEDETKSIEVIAFPAIIERNPLFFQENKIVMISGKVDARDGVPKIIANEIEEVVEE